ncbi:MAG: thermonuclease family protein [Gemmatimonadetes bacterium]|nr:thermonuclease family protein [Gemmatimonadota bacterium]
MRYAAAHGACAVAFLLLGAGRSSAQSPEEQIRAEVAGYVRTVNSGNADALAALYVNRPGVGSLGDGQIYRGWSAVADLIRGVYQRVGPIQMTADSVRVMPLGEDAAVAYFRYRWVLGQGSARSVAGAMTLVFQRTPRGWRVAHDHTSTLQENDAPGPSAPVLADSGPPAPVRETSACVVTRVVDGDTVDCEQVGRVRLIGIDTPERSQAPYGGRAAQALARLVPVGSSVQLELDVEPRDRYGRVLAYLWTNGVLVNWAMVRQGWAVLLTYPPNVQYVDWFTAAQSQARETGVGLWATGGFDCLPAERRRGRCDE